MSERLRIYSNLEEVLMAYERFKIEQALKKRGVEPDLEVLVRASEAMRPLHITPFLSSKNFFVERILKWKKKFNGD